MIKSLARLSKGGQLEPLIEGLTDKVSSVSAEALKGLALSASLVGNERLWQIFCMATHGHVKRNVFSLLEQVGKWDSIYYLVKSASDSDAKVAATAQLSIQRWLSRFNDTFYAPTSQQKFKLLKVLEECGDHLDERTNEDLRFLMKGF